jgi:uncharacterized repeat protein (TIGR01451 family)
MNSQVLLARLKKLVCSLAFLAFASAPSLVGAIDITVTGTADTADGPDTCAVATTVSCPSLRSAIRYANETSPDPDTITLSAGTYTLSIDGVDETWAGAGTEADPYVAVITPDATIGDLDITDSLTITGAVDVDEKLLTTIAWDVQKNVADPALDLEQGDRIFHVQALTGTTVSVAFSNLILANGSVGVIPNTNCEIADYPYDIEIVPAESCSIYQFRRFGGAIALGPGANIAFYVAAEHGPDTPGGGGKKPPDVGPGGDEPEEGGTISDVTIYRVAVIDNAAGADAGGIYNAAPTAIEESVISGNLSGANGGGIYNDAELTINKTTIGTAASVPFIIDSALLANPNQGENGGGIFDTGFHTTTIANTSINGNTAIGGGGIAGRSLIVFNITNTTISGNIASDVGGGITTNGTINLNSSTVANNEASTDAPGGGAGLNSFGSGTYNLHNTIVANNLKNTTVDSNCGCSGGSETCPPGAIVSIGYNLENANTCGLGLASDLPSTDPQLAALANNGGLTETHALPHTANGDGVDSPAVDAGDTANCPNNDQRGSIRPANGDLAGDPECDIGAFELYIPTADLHFNNMTAPDEVNKDSTLAVVAEVHNTSVDPADNVEVITTFPAELTSPSATFAVDGGAASGCVTATNVVTCTIGTLAADSVAVIDLSSVASAAGSYSVSSEVTTTTADPVPENNFASVTTTVIGVSDIQVLAVADQASVDIGDNVTITATLTNAGPDDATTVRVGTTIPDEVTLVSATPSAGSCGSIDEDRGVACSIGDIANGGTATVTYVATVNDAGSINWDVETSAYQTDSDASNNSAEVAFTGVANADLALSLGISDDSLEEGSTVALVYTVVNQGPQAATGVTLNITLPSGWVQRDLSATQGNCSLSAPTLTCNIGDLAIDGDAKITVWGTVGAVVTVNISADVAANENDPDADNNTRDVNIKFEEEQNFFEELFGCTMSRGPVFDPTLLLVVIFSLLHLARKELKASGARK